MSYLKHHFFAHRHETCPANSTGPWSLDKRVVCFHDIIVWGRKRGWESEQFSENQWGTCPGRKKRCSGGSL
jgi:hypothetical protein